MKDLIMKVVKYAEYIQTGALKQFKEKRCLEMDDFDLVMEKFLKNDKILLICQFFQVKIDT